jgi:hypothetical protein
MVRKFLSLILFILFCGSSYASTFKYELLPDWEKPRRLDLLEMKFAMSSRGFYALDLKEAGRMKWIAVDQIYSSPDMREVIFLKMGLKPSDKTQMNQILRGQEGALYHSEARDGNSYALFFVNVPEKKMKEVIAALPKKTGSTARLFDLVFPEAHADTIADPFGSPSPAEVSGLSSLVLAGGAATCAGQAVEGAKGAAMETWNAAKQLVTDPWGFWSSVKSKFSQFKDALANVNKEVDQLMNTLSTIDRDTALAVACSIAGQAAFAALLTAGGIGVAKGLATLTKILLQLRAFRAVLERVARLKAAGKASSRDVSALVGGVMSCAI